MKTFICGSIKDFDKLLSRINYLEKKVYALQKSMRELLEMITNNQVEILKKLQENIVTLSDRTDSCAETFREDGSDRIKPESVFPRLSLMGFSNENDADYCSVVNN